MKKKINRFVYWTPRILGIIFILFLSIFSLDVFDSASSFGEILIGLFMHNIPVIILLVILIISWKHELVGAITFILAGLLYIARLLITIIMNPPFEWYMLSWSVTIAGPAFLVGILFFINWYQKKKEN